MISYLTPEEITALQSSGLKTESPFMITGVSRTQFSVARHYGGVTAYGCEYIYDHLSDTLIRHDVVRWIGKERKRVAKEKKLAAGGKQKTLF